MDENTVRDVFRSWGPGKFDAELLLDGQAFAPDGSPAATLIPPAFGLAGVNLHTWTGWGSVTHWNAFVAISRCTARARSMTRALKTPSKFPIAAANGFGDVRNDPDLDHAEARGAALLPARAPGAAPPHGQLRSSGRGEARRRLLRRW